MKEILYFSADWCEPCKQLGPTMESLKDQITYKRINVDSLLNQDLAREHSVRNVPTLILLENGKYKNRLVGNQTAEAILDFYNG